MTVDKEFNSPTLHMKAWRSHSGLTQEQVSIQSGYSRGYVGKMETRPGNCTVGFLAAFAEVVGAPNVQALFSHPETADPQREEMLVAFAQLSARRKQLLTGIALELAGAPINPTNDVSI